MYEFNVAILDWSYMFRLLIIQYPTDIYNILKKGIISFVYNCSVLFYIQDVHLLAMYCYYVF